MKNDFLTEFYNHCLHSVHDFDPKTRIICDGKRHRAGILGKKGKKKPISYCLNGDNGFYYGYVRDFREGKTWAWHSKSEKKLNATERAEQRAAIAKMKADALIERENENKRAARAANYIWAHAQPATGTPYANRKKMGIAGLKQSGDTLLIPVWIGNEIKNIQKIYPDGGKFFLKGTTLGGYCWIGTPTKGGTAILCEGYATGDSIARATGLPVCVAFNAGNLMTVAKLLHRAYTVIIAADNDAETIVRGTPYNTGVIKAREAAESIGGARVIVPTWNLSAIDNAAPDTTLKACDFNDIELGEGLDAVKAFFNDVIDTPETYDLPEPEISQDDKPRATSQPFDILGYDNGSYYYLPHATKQVVCLSASSHSLQNLLQLAPKEYWDAIYGAGDTSASKVSLNAANHLINACHRAGTFKTEERLRGSGVWMDSGESVYNYGIGTHNKPEGSTYYYVNSAVLPDLSDPLTNARAAELYDLVKLFPFRDGNLAAGLVAGWLALAPICGALEWRSHIWVTGGAGSGKSTLLDVMRRVLGRYALTFDGGSTEAGLRASMMFDSRPIIMDEAEGETQRQRESLQAILEYARKSSRGGYITKSQMGGGGYINYACRGMFCFSAINPILREGADESRITLITMNKRDDREAYQEILRAIDNLFTGDYTGAFIARSIANVSTTLANIKAFKHAGSYVLGAGMRGADQIGTLLAGLYSLHSTRRISKEDAVKWMQKQDFAFVKEQTETQDHQRLLERICSHVMRVQTDSRISDATIGSLISASFNDSDSSMSADTAIRALRRVGIKPDQINKTVYIANNGTALASILKDTPWSAKWARPLLEFDGATKTEPMHFDTGLTSRAVCVPYKAFQ